MWISRVSRPGALYDASVAAGTFGDVIGDLRYPCVSEVTTDGHFLERDIPKSTEWINFPAVKGFLSSRERILAMRTKEIPKKYKRGLIE